MARSETRSNSSETTNPPASNGANPGGKGQNGLHASDNGVTPDDALIDEAAEAADGAIDETDGFDAPEVIERTAIPDGPVPTTSEDVDPAETEEWLESLRYVLESKGPERVNFLLAKLDEVAHRAGVELPFSAATP